MKTKQLTIGILAHVDAGKTTLAECILYETGSISEIGRVDHQDAFLDTYDLEKSRGITIFSKQAVFSLGDFAITLLDTPGHVDFSTEMERTLRVLDYAILVISGTDGIQGHTLTVWKLLQRYHVPTLIFVNKMDLPGADKSALMSELQNRVDENCVEFDQSEDGSLWETLAVFDDLLMEKYLEHGCLESKDIGQAIVRRHVFPVYYGSALKNEGVQTFLQDVEKYIQPKSYPDLFGARVFKVARNIQGERLTYVKLTGGTLKVKTLLSSNHQKNVRPDEEAHQNIWQEKVDEIRIYSGASYETAKEVTAGTVCALTGLSETKPGDGLGFEYQGDAPALLPVLSYKVQFPEGTNIYGMLKNLKILEEEEPHLNILWNEHLSEVQIQVMGEIQLEILKSTIEERFGVVVAFDKGSLVYRETIAKSVLGVGHFEPLKHYAEVQLLLEPLEQGSGMEYSTDCSEDVLDRNWQRLVISHLNERKHPGVLTGSELTDMRVTLVTGRGHNKHTEGGDFRQATFRALRQGLMKTKNILLEPVYDYTLDLPKEFLGRAMSDIERMHGRYDPPTIDGENVNIKGAAPVSSMMHYGTEVVVYSRGQGRLGLSFKGYEPCYNQEAVIEALGYDPEEDIANPAGSVFCSKGTGYGVSWDEADKHMHMDSGIHLEKNPGSSENLSPVAETYTRSYSDNDDELEAIFIRTYGERKEQLPVGGNRLFKPANQDPPVKNTSSLKNRTQKIEKHEDRYLLVDGYNIVFAWDELKALASENLDAARLRLMDLLCNYQGQTEEIVILVFDAYRVAGNQGDISAYHNIFVVYTKEAVTADQYIERLVHNIRPDHEVTVATSDVVEQVIILGKGAKRLSADGLKIEMDNVEKNYKEHLQSRSTDTKHRPFHKFLKDK